MKTNSKKIKVISILMIVMLLILSLSTIVNASSVEGGYKTMIGQADGVGLGDKVNKIGNIIIGVIQIVGTGIAIIMLVLAGMKYMSAAPNERAEIKKGLVIYVIGAIMFFSAVGIVTILKNTIEKIK